MAEGRSYDEGIIFFGGRNTVMNGKPKGFTLIELMIALVIAAIVLAIAIPAFTEQLAKSRRADAISGLTCPH